MGIGTHRYVVVLLASVHHRCLHHLLNLLPALILPLLHPPRHSPLHGSRRLGVDLVSPLPLRSLLWLIPDFLLLGGGLAARSHNCRASRHRL